MGGHITAAAIEDEAALTANNKVKYAVAVPMCAVAGDTKLFDTFAAIQVAAQAKAGLPSYPKTNGWKLSLWCAARCSLHFLAHLHLSKVHSSRRFCKI